MTLDVEPPRIDLAEQLAVFRIDGSVANLIDQRIHEGGVGDPAQGGVGDQIHGAGGHQFHPGPDQSAATPEGLAVVLFTSGSTGRPKGVLHTHRALAHKARLMATVHGLGPGDAVLMPAPLAHVSGLLNGVLLPGVVPMKAVLMARWSAERALALIRELTASAFPDGALEIRADGEMAQR